MMKRIRRLFSGASEKSDPDKSSLGEDDIYYSPLSSSYSEDSSSVSPSTTSMSTPNKTLFRTSVTDPTSAPSAYPKAMTGCPGTWRLAIDKLGERLYTTNNHGPGEYTILSLQKGKQDLIKTVQCEYIWNIRGIAVDDLENVYLSGDHKIQKYNAEGKLVASFGWSEPGSEWYQCNDPNGISCYMDQVYICDSRNSRIQVLSNELKYIASIDNGEHLSHPEDIEFDSKGQMHVLDSGNHSIVVFDSDGKFVYDINFPEHEMPFPVSMRMIGGHYFVSDLSKLHVAVFSSAGELLHKILVISREELAEDVDGFVHVCTTTLQRPLGLAVDFNGYIYVSNIDSKEIQIF